MKKKNENEKKNISFSKTFFQHISPVFQKTAVCIPTKKFMIVLKSLLDCINAV